MPITAKIIKRKKSRCQTVTGKNKKIKVHKNMTFFLSVISCCLPALIRV